MQTRNPLFNDLAKVAGAALGVAGGVRDELEAQIRSRLDRVLAQMDLVTREEFEAVREMAAKAREEQESLREEVAALHAKLDALGKGGVGAKAKAAKKPAPKAAKPSTSTKGAATTGNGKT